LARGSAGYLGDCPANRHTSPARWCRTAVGVCGMRSLSIESCIGHRSGSPQSSGKEQRKRRRSRRRALAALRATAEQLQQLQRYATAKVTQALSRQPSTSASRPQPHWGPENNTRRSPRRACDPSLKTTASKPGGVQTRQALHLRLEQRHEGGVQVDAVRHEAGGGGARCAQCAVVVCGSSRCGGRAVGSVSVSTGGSWQPPAAPATCRFSHNQRGQYLDINQLSGSISSELGQLGALTDLYLNGNQLSGKEAFQSQSHMEVHHAGCKLLL
jgi:hypothetical protein